MKVKRMFPTPPAVQKFVLDFKAATWKAIRSVFPGVMVTVCAFHWTQAVWKKVQALGLSVNDNDDAGTHKVIRCLLVMPLLPTEHITAAINHQRGKAVDSERIRDLFNYVKQTWIHWSIVGAHRFQEVTSTASRRFTSEM